MKHAPRCNLSRGSFGAKLVVFGVMALGGVTPVRAQCLADWASGFDLPAAGVGGSVRAYAVFDDGSGAGPALYVGGGFTTAGGVTVNRIAKWDGSTWSPLGIGMNNVVYALAVFDDGAGTGPALYAGGIFTTAGGVEANRIARWDGASWSPLGSGVGSGAVYALRGAESGPFLSAGLYVGGSFSTAGGFSAPNVARWDGSAWSAMGTTLNSQVNVLEVFNDPAAWGPTLYAGGGFTTSIRRWNGSTWSTVGSGFNGTVTTLAAFDDGSGLKLYAGGDFTSSGSASVSRIARWNGMAWSPLGNSSIDYSVRALRVLDPGSGLGSRLLVGGDFTSIGPDTMNGIAQWDGSSWATFGPGLNDTVYALVDFDDGSGEGAAIHAGGDFLNSGLMPLNRCGRWDGVSWSSLQAGSGAEDMVTALHVLNDGAQPVVYARGSFLAVGDMLSNQIAKWSGERWEWLGGGVANGDVRALALFDDDSVGGADLYAAGSFTAIGGVSVNRIAKWDGATWSPLGTGKNIPVNALAVYDDGLGGGEALYAAGDFFVAGGLPVNHIARWDGEAWTSLGELGGGPADGNVNALVVFDDGTGPSLYVGGGFTFVNDNPIGYLAKWNGIDWSAVGGGTNGAVNALDVIEIAGIQALYVRGSFSTAGGQNARNIAAWNSQQWNRFSGGTFGSVKAWAVYDHGAGPVLYATGDFTTIGGITANRIAKWNGSSWSSVGNFGLNGTGNALSVFNDGTGPALYVAGNFTVAAGLAARRLARWNGVEWSVVDIGLNSGADYTGTALVNALAVLDEGEGRGLYVGGFFESAGGIPSRNFARWDGCLPEACCLSGESCMDLSETGCAAQAGTSHGAGTTCAATIPTISEHPIATTACTETALTLSVFASGAGPLAYQWRKDGEALSDGGNILGSATESLTANPVGLADAGSYDVVVSNGCGVETSDPAMVSVEDPPRGHCDAGPDVDLADYAGFEACWTGPGGSSGAGCECVDFDCDDDTDLTDFAGFQAVFSVCDGAPPVVITTAPAICVGATTGAASVPNAGTGATYVWSLTGGTLTGGQGSWSITYTAGAGPTLTLDVTVEDVSGCQMLGNEVVTVNSNPSAAVTTAPVVCAGSTQNGATVPNAGPGATYAWNVNGGTLTSGQGTTAITYTAGAGATVTLTVIVTDANGCVGNGNTQVTVRPNPSAEITTASGVCSGSVGNVASVPNAGPGASYVWTVTGGALTAGQATRTITYTAGGVSPLTLDITVTNLNGCVSTGTHPVTINANPSVVITAENPVCAGSTGNAASVPNAGPGASYAWSVTGGSAIVGQGTPNMTYTAGAGPTVTLDVTVENASGCQAAGNVVVTVDPLTSVTADPTDMTVNTGDTAQFTVTANGANLTYQWQFDDGLGGGFVDLADAGDISGAASDTLSIANAAAADEGDFRCIVDGDCGPTDTSASAALTVN